MAEHTIEFSIFMIFTGAAIFATIALYARQAMIVAYIVLGLILGPSGLSLVDDAQLISDISNIGIIFLLYLLGLDLLPQQLWQMLREAVVVTFASSVAFCLLGFLVGFIFGYELLQALLIGAVMMFSSTIIVEIIADDNTASQAYRSDYYQCVVDTGSDRDRDFIITAGLW